MFLYIQRNIRMIKKITLILTAFAAFAAFISCTETDCIEGSRTLAYIPYNDLAPFNKIVLELPGSVVFESAASDTNLLITADDNIMQYVDIRVENSTLFISSTDDGVSLCPSRLRFNVFSTDELNSVDITGSGSFYTEDSLAANDFYINITGSGKTDIENLETSGLTCNITGSGQIVASGTADELISTITGSGEIDLLEMLVKKANVTIEGSGNYDLWISDELTAAIIGSGTIIYKGSPTINSNITGSGVIKQYDN